MFEHVGVIQITPEQYKKYWTYIENGGDSGLGQVYIPEQNVLLCHIDSVQQLQQTVNKVVNN